jgi:glycosyltransferase involved in cell wall biosynthesis
MKKNILILNTYFLPGYKGGGPVKSINNIVSSNLSGKYNFYIITSDRDLNDNKPYENIIINQWLNKNDYKICYINRKNTNFKLLRDLINSIEFTHIYLNGYFSPYFTIKPLILKKLGLLNCKSFIISPRGDFSPGHLNIKRFKKYTYIIIAKILGLYKGLLWQSTSGIETNHILGIYKNSKIKSASNLPFKNPGYNEIYYKNKNKNSLKLVFLSRIVPKKNLLFALECLREIEIDEGSIEFAIYGPKEDSIYWTKCEQIIDTMKNKNIKVVYKGELKQEKVIEELSNYHAFFFPTFGENYGHVIVESMLAGCIPLISDQTPWQNLSDLKIGWDIGLDNKKGFIEAIHELLEMNQEQFNLYSNNTFDFILKESNYDKILKETEELFM